MFLVDTNIWLELLLDQEKADEVREFLQTVRTNFLAITEFSLYSIGIILTRFQKDALFTDFLSDTIENAKIMRICLAIEELKEIPSIKNQFKLDFDDAYQYIAATRYNCMLVSFDTDFDTTDQKRKSPQQAIKLFLDNNKIEANQNPK